MAKAWVLDTDTKGTGAEMVPLEKLERQRQRGRDRERISVIRRTPLPPEAATEDSERDAERRFKLVNVLSREVLGDGVGPRGAKGAGEGSLNPVGPAVVAAVARAIGRWPTRLPLTPERVWRLMNDLEEV